MLRNFVSYPRLSKKILDSKSLSNVGNLVIDSSLNYVPNVCSFLGRVRSIEEDLEVIDI